MYLELMMNQGDSANNLDTYLQYLQNFTKLLRHANYVKTRNLNPARVLSYPCIFKIGYHPAMKIKRIPHCSFSEDTKPVSYDECNHTIASKVSIKSTMDRASRNACEERDCELTRVAQF